MTTKQKLAASKLQETAGNVSKAMKEFAGLDRASVLPLKDAINKLNLSPRAFHRVIKIARTIADLESSIKIKSNHVAEALQYRPQIES